MKFGGTSVADLNKMRNVATKVQAEIKKGNNVIIVVSAMAGITDELINKITEFDLSHRIDQ